MVDTSDTKNPSEGTSENPPPYQPDSEVALPIRTQGENSTTLSEKSTQTSDTETPAKNRSDPERADDSEDGVLVFVEGMIQDRKLNFVSANIFQHPDTNDLYTYDEFVDGDYGWKQGDLHVAYINLSDGYCGLRQKLVDSITRNQPKYIVAKGRKQQKVAVFVIVVLWERLESSYSKEGCKSRLTLKTDSQIRMVLGKMKERGWKDRFVVEFTLEKFL